MEAHDRQALLEQKRQRLEELKQKRLLNSNKEKSAVDDLIKLHTSVNKPKVDFAIQVEPLPDEVPKEVPAEKERTTFDKGFQTDNLDNDEELEKEEPRIKEPKESAPVKETIHFDEVELNRSIRESIKMLNKVIVEDSIDTTNIIDYGNKESSNPKRDKVDIPFDMKHNIRMNEGSRITALNVSPHFNDLIVVAYSKSRSDPLSKDIAIVYNTKNSKAFAEYFLASLSEITEIKFDRFNSSKIIGGLTDGKVVIWDFASRDYETVEVLPVLSTPLFGSYHISPISSIKQVLVDSNEITVTSSFDGSINFWTTNFLESPMFETKKLFTSKIANKLNETEEQLRISKSVAQDSDTLDHLKPLVERALETLIVTTENGRLYKVESSSEVIPFQMGNDDTESFVATSMASLGSGTIITAHLDWCLRLWDSVSSALLVKIPITHIVFDLAVRPNHPWQFVTVGTKIDSVVQFWDLKTRLWNPIFDIVTEHTDPVAVSFTADGNNLIIAFSYGVTTIWSLDSPLLTEKLKEHSNVDVDPGISKLLKNKLI